MRRRKDRRKQEATMKVALVTAALGLAKVILEVTLLILKWLDR